MTVITPAAPVAADAAGVAPAHRRAHLALVASVAIVGSRLLTSNGADDGLAATAMIPQGDEAVFAFTSSRVATSSRSGRTAPTCAS